MSGVVNRIGLKLPEVALAIGVSPNTILKMVEEGVLPRPRQWHKLKIWRVAELDAALYRDERLQARPDPLLLPF
jgi:predicted DNA-binding transcriptional regulator AlpA